MNAWRTAVTQPRGLKFCMRVTLPKGVLSLSGTGRSHHFKKSWPTLMCEFDVRLHFLPEQAESAVDGWSGRKWSRASKL